MSWSGRLGYQVLTIIPFLLKPVTYPLKLLKKVVSIR